MREGRLQGDEERVDGPPEDFLDEYIQDFIDSRDSIFKNRDVLTPGYRPSQPVRREVQVKKLISHLMPCFSNQVPGNLLIYGKTGTGKTLVTRHVTDKIKHHCETRGLKPPFITYINVNITNTKYRILRRICQDVGVEGIPKTGLATDQVLEELKEHLSSRKRVLVVVIDEIDLMVRSREKDDLLYLLTRLSEEEPLIKISVIGISNDLRFKTFLGVRVLSSMNAQEIVFPPYKHEELLDILLARAIIAFQEGVCDEHIINAIAAMSAREHGDARKAIAHLLAVGEVAEQRGLKRVEPEHILVAKDKLEYDTVERFVLTLPVQFQITLIAVSNACEHFKGIVNTGSLLKVFHELVGLTSLYSTNIGERRLLQIMKDLENHGLIELQVTSIGRGGQFNVATMCLDRPTVIKIFKKHDQLKQLLNHVPKISSLDSFLKN